MRIDLWTYGINVPDMSGLTGLDVEATDGSIGHVDEATFDVGASYLVVDTGRWIFGKKVLLPASMIRRIDLDNRKVFVGSTKDQIRSAPEFDEKAYKSQDYRDRVGSYYAALA